MKIKVAAYPGRIRFGSIDPTKVNLIHLDFSELYGEAKDMREKESEGADFVKRLLQPRFKHYAGKSIESYFDTKKESMDDYYELLFEASNGVPRTIGWLLKYVLDSRWSQDRLADARSIKSAAKRHYEDQILPALDSLRFRDIAYDTKLEFQSQFEILKEFVQVSRKASSAIKSGKYKAYETLKNPPTSHLYFKTEYEKYIDFLELGFFVSKQRSASVREGVKSSVYALNYGLCEANNIVYGRPKGGAYRTYPVESIFDVNDVIETYLQNHKQIVCLNCAAVFPMSKYETIQAYDMECPECRTEKSCSVKTWVDDDSKLKSDDQRPSVELDIIHVLNTNDGGLYSVEIGREADCSFQRAGARARKLVDEHLLRMEKENRGKGDKQYFSVDYDKASKYLTRVYKAEIETPDTESDDDDEKDLLEGI